MKIIFDSEEQKRIFLAGVDRLKLCPHDIGIDQTDCIHCNTCEECWQNCGIEMEVEENE